MNDIIVISILLFTAWVLQGVLNLVQQKKFLSKIKELRKNGDRVVIGLAGTNYKGKAYSLLSINESGIITNAEILRGWSTFSKIKAEPRLQGIDISEIEEVCISTKIPQVDKLAYLNAALNFNQQKEVYEETEMN